MTRSRYLLAVAIVTAIIATMLAVLAPTSADATQLATLSGTAGTPDGKARDARSDVRVILWGMTESNGHWFGTGGGQQAALAANGDFSIAVRPGTYRLCVEDPQHRYVADCLGGGTPGYPDTYHRIDVAAGQVIGNLAIALQPFGAQGSISGRISEPDGSALFAWLDGSGNFTERGSVYAVNASGSHRADPAADGTYSLPNLPVGSYKLRYTTFWGQYKEGWLGSNGQFTATESTATTIRVEQDVATRNVNGHPHQAVFLAGRVDVDPGAPTPPSGGNSTRLGCVVPVVRNADTGETVAFRSNVRDDAYLRGYWSVTVRDSDFSRSPLGKGNYTVTFTDVSDQFPNSCGERYYETKEWTDTQGSAIIRATGIHSNINAHLQAKTANAPVTQPQPQPVPPTGQPAPQTPTATAPNNPLAQPTPQPAAAPSAHRKTCRNFTGRARGHVVEIRYCAKKWTKQTIKNKKRAAKRVAIAQATTKRR